MAKELTPAGPGQIRELVNRFTRNLPQGASQMYDAKPGDGYGETTIDVPDGRYRVYGSEWIVTVRKGAFVSAARAVPPHFGGTRGGPVIEIFDDSAPAQRAAAGLPEPDVKELQAQGWWPPDKVAEITSQIDALCKEPITTGNTLRKPNPKFDARLMVLASAVGIEVPAEALAEAQKLVGG